MNHDEEKHLKKTPLSMTDEARRPAEFDELSEGIIVPVVEERAHLTEQTSDTAHVRIKKNVVNEEHLLSGERVSDEVEIQHVPLNQFIEVPPPTRTEGDTIVIPIIEEIPVVEIRLLLKEEIRIRRKTMRSDVQIPVTLRKEQVTVERENLETDSRTDSRIDIETTQHQHKE